MMATRAAGPADPLHLGQAGLAAVPGGGGEGRARDHQVSGTAGHGQVVEEAVGHPGAAAVIRSCELPVQDLAQRRRGLNRHDLPRAVDELQRQPSGARAHLDDPVRACGSHSSTPGWSRSAPGQPVVELRFQPVQQLPGQGDVGPRIAAPPARNGLPRRG